MQCKVTIVVVNVSFKFIVVGLAGSSCVKWVFHGCGCKVTVETKELAAQFREDAGGLTAS